MAKPHYNPLKMGNKEYADNYARKLNAYLKTQEPRFIENELRELLENGAQLVLLNGWAEKTKYVLSIASSIKREKKGRYHNSITV